MNQMVTQSVQRQLNLEVDHQVTKKQTKYNIENGEEYVRLT
jgi:hypothetical protein